MAGIGKEASLALVALVASCCLISSPAASSSPAPSPGQATAPRIVNGKETSIERWPWQVALLDRRLGSSQTARYFCSGSLIAPDLVVTAAHCVADYRPGSLANLEVVAGRTYLNRTSTGESLPVERVLMPLDSEGRRKYRIRGGAAIWDVALLKLSAPSTVGTPIAIAGASEEASWEPGRLVKTTGWGYTGGVGGSVSNRLQIANQVILPDGVCERAGFYQPTTMICLGGPRGGSSACSGDSGGPLVSPVGDGWRLIGMTSFGDFYCRGYIPSVDNRTAADPVRKWIREESIAVSGYDPVSEGGTIGPLPESCKVPGLNGRTRQSARKALLKANCRLEGVRYVGLHSRRKGRVVASSLPMGWLAPVGFGIRVAITR